MVDRHKRAVALFFVVLTVMVVLVLAAVILNTMVSQSRLTHHQVSRIQAYYVSQAGIFYAMEMLRTGLWTTASCPSPGGCAYADSAFPNTIQNKQVIIRIIQPGLAGCINPPGNSACVKATTTYTYTP